MKVIIFLDYKWVVKWYTVRDTIREISYLNKLVVLLIYYVTSHLDKMSFHVSRGVSSALNEFQYTNLFTSTDKRKINKYDVP